MTDFDDPCELERELLDIAERYEQFYDDALAAADEKAMDMLENVPLQCQAVGVPKPSVFGDQEVRYKIDPDGPSDLDPEDAAEACFEAVQAYYEAKAEARSAYFDHAHAEGVLHLYQEMFAECEHLYKDDEE